MKSPPSTALAPLLAILMVAGAAADDDESGLVRQGFAISPIAKADLNSRREDRDRVGFGSFIVNAIGDCSGCHSFPQYLAKGDPAGSNPAANDPFLGLPSDEPAGERPLVANFNTLHYLAGGQCFGPFMTRNLTPDQNGLPEGLTEAEFVKVLRTGEDIHCEKEPSDPICALGPNTPTLRVMPWPTYHNMTDEQLKAIYGYLRAVPPAEPCNTVVDGCAGFLRAGDEPAFGPLRLSRHPGLSEPAADAITREAPPYGRRRKLPARHRPSEPSVDPAAPGNAATCAAVIFASQIASEGPTVSRPCRRCRDQLS